MPVTDAPAKARALYDARRHRVPIAPFTDADPTLGMADGYAVQRELIALLLADGDRLVGHKVGPDVQTHAADDRRRLAGPWSGAGLHRLPRR
jgi:2-keto-4-pentenoate hydratase